MIEKTTLQLHFPFDILTKSSCKMCQDQGKFMSKNFLIMRLNFTSLCIIIVTSDLKKYFKCKSFMFKWNLIETFEVYNVMRRNFHR